MYPVDIYFFFILKIVFRYFKISLKGKVVNSFQSTWFYYFVIQMLGYKKKEGKPRLERRIWVPVHVEESFGSLRGTNRSKIYFNSSISKIVPWTKLELRFKCSLSARVTMASLPTNKADVKTLRSLSGRGRGRNLCLIFDMWSVVHHISTQNKISIQKYSYLNETIKLLLNWLTNTLIVYQCSVGQTCQQTMSSASSSAARWLNRCQG